MLIISLCIFLIWTFLLIFFHEIFIDQFVILFILIILFFFPVVGFCQEEDVVIEKKQTTVKHQMDLDIQVDGDLEVDEHHTIEDTAIALGEVFHNALGNKLGIERYGFCLPMDDCLAQVAIDFGGRNWLVWDADFKREMVGDMPTEMFYHFFKSFSDTAKCNLNIKAEGKNEHHKIEAIFKAVAKSIKMAKQIDFNNKQLPSTKGVL